MRILLFSLNILLLASCSSPYEQEVKQESQLDIPLMNTLDFSIVDFDSLDIYDTRIAFSDSFFIALNYDVGHGDFYASTARVITQQSDHSRSEMFDVQKAESRFKQTADSLGLDIFTAKEFIALLTQDSSSLKNKVLIQETCNTQFKLKYSQKGIVTLEINSNNTSQNEVLLDELLPSHPSIGLFDFNKDSKKELVLFIPSYDYWPSQCFQVLLFDISDCCSN
ncbi:MAG: hypothetical protein Crog4KO_21240 [Crocinitomicaceae bacterium]